MKDSHETSKRTEALNRDGGIQSLLDSACTVLGNPIVMFDTEYRLLAYTKTVTDDSFWNELMTYGVFSYESQVLFMEMGFVDAVANTDKIAFLITDRLKYDRILGKLYNEHHIHVANLLIVACNNPFSEDDPEVFETVCDLMTAEIIKSELYKTYGTMYQETYIRKLIDGEITEKALYAAHVAIVYNGFKSEMRLLAADIGVDKPEEYLKLSYYRDLLRQTQAGFSYAIYKKYILIIIDSNKRGFDAERDLGNLFELFEEYNIYCGVSGGFDNMYELQRYYLEAAKALERGLENEESGRYFLCDENGREI